MRFESPVVSPDARRPAFFDGMDEDQARLAFACAGCGVENSMSLLSFVSRAERWFDALDDVSRLQVVRLFRNPLGESLGKLVVRSHDETSPCFGLVDCSACARTHLVYLSFGEIQPARYQARLHGIALLAPHPVESTQTLPLLSLVMPLASGRLLLRFQDGTWALTHAMLATDLHRFAAGPLGIAWDARSGLDVVGLHASSGPIADTRHTWLLGCRWHAGHRETGFGLQPFAAEPLVLYDIDEAGTRVETFMPQTLRNIEGWQQRLEDADCAWAINVFAHADHCMAGLQAVVSAAVRRDGALYDPFPILPHRSSRQAASACMSLAGWRAEPGEPPLRCTTGSSSVSDLIDDIAHVVERMQRRRVADNAQAADALMFRVLTTQFEICVHWYDGDHHHAIGDRTYTLDLGELRTSWDADDFEALCDETIRRYARNHKPSNLLVRLRIESE